MPNSCSTCGTPASLVCSRCKKTHYCGTDHQKEDWTEHKKLCRKPTKKVILLTNASGNTGYSPLPNLACQALTLPEPTSFVKCKSMSTDEIQKWVVQQGYTEYRGSLTDAIGLTLSVYAQPYKWADEHQGKNNVMATHLVCALDSGLAPHTILGPALVVRRDREGNVIDLEKDELVRLTFFINDCMQDWDPDTDVGRLATVVRAVFPYYDMNKGDTFRGDGFRAENRVCSWNGSQLKLKPADMQFAATYVNTHSS